LNDLNQSTLVHHAAILEIQLLVAGFSNEHCINKYMPTKLTALFWQDSLPNVMSSFAKLQTHETLAEFGIVVFSSMQGTTHALTKLHDPI